MRLPEPSKPSPRRACPERRRRDGWTPARQLRFLDVLARTRSVTRAAAAAGMSRESAYRLRARDPDGLFAAAWDRAVLGHKLVNFAFPDRRKDHAVSRGNPAKVTKFAKFVSPRFNPAERSTS